MATFDSTKTSLGELLEQIAERKSEFPDFERRRAWKDALIRK
jgi:hypothetical protein